MVVAAHSSSDMSPPQVIAQDSKSPLSCTTQQQQHRHNHDQQQQPQQQHPQKQQAAVTGQPGAGAIQRRTAVLECEDSERWKGYTESLWKAALWEEGDEWTIYQVRASCVCVWGGGGGRVFH
jgi:hypothetical protein